MNEARAGWLGREFIPQMAVGGHGKAFLFRCAIDVGRNDQSVPVNEFRGIGVVEQVDRDRDAFAEADERGRTRPL